jgi:hypothetical protein
MITPQSHFEVETGTIAVAGTRAFQPPMLEQIFS